MAMAVNNPTLIKAAQALTRGNLPGFLDLLRAERPPMKDTFALVARESPVFAVLGPWGRLGLFQQIFHVYHPPGRYWVAGLGGVLLAAGLAAAVPLAVAALAPDVDPGMTFGESGVSLVFPLKSPVSYGLLGSAGFVLGLATRGLGRLIERLTMVCYL